MAQPPPYYPADPSKAAYPPQPQPGYPAQPPAYPQQPGYPPQGYPPQGPPGYPSPQGQPGYAPPQGQPGYAPPQGQPVHQQHTTIIQQQPVTTIVTGMMFGEAPVSMACPHCHASIITATEYVPGSLAWIICVIIFFLFWPCCWLPFVIDGCKDVLHSCPNCRRQVGAYRRM